MHIADITIADSTESLTWLGTGTMITIIIDDIIVETCNLTRVRPPFGSQCRGTIYVTFEALCSPDKS
jgi:hypothetical protein